MTQEKIDKIINDWQSRTSLCSSSIISIRCLAEEVAMEQMREDRKFLEFLSLKDVKDAYHRWKTEQHPGDGLALAFYNGARWQREQMSTIDERKEWHSNGYNDGFRKGFWKGAEITPDVVEKVGNLLNSCMTDLEKAHPEYGDYGVPGDVLYEEVCKRYNECLKI